MFETIFLKRLDWKIINRQSLKICLCIQIGTLRSKEKISGSLRGLGVNIKKISFELGNLTQVWDWYWQKSLWKIGLNCFPWKGTNFGRFTLRKQKSKKRQVWTFRGHLCLKLPMLGGLRYVTKNVEIDWLGMCPDLCWRSFGSKTVQNLRFWTKESGNFGGKCEKREHFFTKNGPKWPENGSKRLEIDWKWFWDVSRPMLRQKSSK